MATIPNCFPRAFHLPAMNGSLTVGERILIRAGFACGNARFGPAERRGEDIGSCTVDLLVDMPLFRHAEE
ncbi:hypothetical protein GCM10027167_60490 [Nocardia heshunensis]